MQRIRSVTETGWLAGSNDRRWGFFQSIQMKPWPRSGKGTSASCLPPGAHSWQVPIIPTSTQPLHLIGFRPPRSTAQLDNFSLSTFCGHQVTRQQPLRQSFSARAYNKPQSEAPNAPPGDLTHLAGPLEVSDVSDEVNSDSSEN